MIAAGLVTHLITVEENLEPLFATAQIRQLPEVRFVAAFTDGLIALGCPGELPQELRNLAHPVDQPLAPSSSTIATDDVTEKLQKIDKTTLRLEYLLDALEPQTPDISGRGIDALIDRIAAVESIVKSQANDGMQEMNASLKELSNRFDAQPDFMAALNAMMSKIEGLTADRADDHSDQEDPVPQIMDQLETIAAQTGQISEIAQEVGSPSEVGTTLTEILTRLDTLTAPDPSDNRIDEMHQMLCSIENKLPDQDHELSAKISNLQEVVSGLAAAPGPTLDLTEQRKSFSQFATVLAMIVKRVEAAANKMTDAGQTPQTNPKLDEILETLSTISQSNETAAEVDMTPVTSELAALSLVINDWPNKLDALQSELASIAQQPKPVLDLTEQRQSFAAFSTTLSTAVQKLEAAIASIENQSTGDATSNTLTGLQEQIAALPRQNTLEPLFENNSLATISEVNNTSDQQVWADKLGEVNANILRLLDQPDLKPVLDAHGAALQTGMQKLEGLESQILRKNETTDCQQEELNAVVQSLPQILDTTVRQATDLSTIEVGLQQLGQTLEKLPDSIGFTEFADTLNMIAKRPDPVLDVTQQQESFARFGTSIDHIIERLEFIADKLAIPDQMGTDQDNLAGALEKFEGMLLAISKENANEFGIITARIQKMADDLDVLHRSKVSPAGPSASEDTSTLSLDDLRMQFAELIATQIQQNAASFNLDRTEMS
ncbi:MAG: hypothetical protein AB8B60_13305 [Sulfitobacter sp.]